MSSLFSGMIIYEQASLLTDSVLFFARVLDQNPFESLGSFLQADEVPPTIPLESPYRESLQSRVFLADYEGK